MPEIAPPIEMLRKVVKNRDSGLIFAAVLAAFVPLIVPLPPVVMDLLIIVNITIAVLLLITTIYIERPLELSSFPSMLLSLTVYRLALNVATTRLILGGDTGLGRAKAGQMVRTFGEIVAGHDVIVGAVIFLILIIIQFVVITKGATRISEVAARFTLDAMPGKQMAIDADLNAGLIDEGEARRRRGDVTREADFYGAMDGASKWVRGDAIAGLIITLVNVLGGLAIGVLRQGMDLGEALSLYTTLTVGDGLVSQVPALIIAVSAGLITTRTASESNLGAEVTGQLLIRPPALFVASALLGVLGLTVFPPLKTLPLAAALGILGWRLQRASARSKLMEVHEAEEAARGEAAPERVDALLKIDPMELEVGYALIPLVDSAQGGQLLDRVTMIRRQVALEMGLVVPPIRIRDNMQLDPNEYTAKIHGVEVTRGRAWPDRFLAMDSGAATEKIPGLETIEPAFGLRAVWIGSAQKDRAQAAGYTVVDAESVVATHLSETIKRHAHEILTREEVTRLLERLKETAAHLIEEVYPKVLSAGEIQKVLQNLLRERVSIRNLEAILEAVGDAASRTRDVEILTEYARNALGRTLSHAAQEEDGKVYVVTLDPAIEETINAAVQRTEGGGSVLALSPARVGRVVEAIGRGVEKLLAAGHPAILLTSPQVRLQVRRMAETVLPSLVVLSYNEIVPEVEVESLGIVTE